MQASRRLRRTNVQLFIAKLTELGGGDRLINSTTVREGLGWESEKYEPVKRQLRDEGIILVQRGGPGGSICLAAPQNGARKLFLSYSHADLSLKVELLKHLKPLERLNLIECWDDGMIPPGDEWGDHIGQQIEDADIILLLISVDFINSKYCYDVELERALERHRDKEARVIPVLLRDCIWQHLPFAKIEGLPSKMKPVKSWDNPDSAFADVAAGIKKILDEGNVGAA